MMSENPALLEFARISMASMTPEQLEQIINSSNQMLGNSPSSSFSPSESHSSSGIPSIVPPSMPSGPASIEAAAEMMSKMEPSQMSNMIKMMQQQPELLKMASAAMPVKFSPLKNFVISLVYLGTL